MEHVLLSQLGDHPEGVPVFDGLAFATPWVLLDRLVLADGESVDCGDQPGAGPWEQGFLVLSGAVELHGEGHGDTISARLDRGPGWLVAPPGQEQRLTHRGTRPAEILRLAVAAASAPHAGVALGRFDREALKWRETIHGGKDIVFLP